MSFKTTIIIILGLLLGLFWAGDCYFSSNVMNVTNTPVSNDTPALSSKNITVDVLKQFFALGQSFAYSHMYNITSYNCVNYSKDFKVILDSYGYDTMLIRGCRENNSGCHMWLRVSFDFEPQDNEIVDYTKKYPNQNPVFPIE